MNHILLQPPEGLFRKYKGDSAIQTSSSLQHASLQRVITSSKESVSTAMNDQTSLLRKDQINIHQEPTEQKLIEGQESNGSANVIKPLISNSLIVNTRQRGNPILKSVRSIPWEYGNIIPDYVMGQSNCALFLSLRYHQLHPNYIHERLKQLGKSYELRVLLVQVDVKESHHLLKDLAKICILADCTLVLAFSPEEAGRYLETYKIFENKPPEAIMEKTEENFIAKFTDCLTRVKSVNKTDCLTLISHFGTLANTMDSSEEDLSLCPGFGPQKAKRLHNIFHEPFIKSTHAGTTS
ncbi:Excision repair cross-complementation group 1 [Bulinus truncatus]|nr:Excision repair cross-complementation group 1 [Bulinus truncatus]